MRAAATARSLGVVGNRKGCGSRGPPGAGTRRASLSRTRRRGSVLSASSALCMLAAVAAASGVALGSRPPRAPTRPPPSATRPADAAVQAAAALAGPVVAAWAGMQRSDGTFPDYVLRNDAPGARRDRYGPAMLGAALVRHSMRTGDRRARDAGLAAIGWAVRHPAPGAQGAFELLALADAYRPARAALGEDPSFERVRRPWEHRLRHARRHVLGIRRGYHNTALVEAMAVLETQGLSLASADPHAIAGGDRATAARLARGLIARALPRLAAATTTASGAGPM